MDDRSLRIAISGTSGTGKSTLGKALADKLSLPFIEEGYDGRITREKNKPLERWESQYLAVLKEKAQREESHEHFVVDRCPIDLMNGWMNNNLHQRLAAVRSRRFLSLCLRRLKHYDFIVITPWDGLEFVEREPDRPGVRRNPNPFVLLRSQSGTVGLAHMFVDKRRIIEIPTPVQDLDERLAFVQDQMARRRQLFQDSQ